MGGATTNLQYIINGKELSRKWLKVEIRKKLIIVENNRHIKLYRSASLSLGGIEDLVSIKNTYNS